MLPLVAVVVFVAVLFCFCAFKKDSSKKGNGAVKEETRQLEGFTVLNASGAWLIEISRGTENTCLISMEENLYDNLVFGYKSGILNISLSESISPTRPMRLVFTLTNFPEQFNMRGAAQITVEESFNQPARCNLEGATSLTFKDNCPLAVIKTRGASNVNFSGEVQKLELTMEGASLANFA